MNRIPKLLDIAGRLVVGFGMSRMHLYQPDFDLLKAHGHIAADGTLSGTYVDPQTHVRTKWATAAYPVRDKSAPIPRNVTPLKGKNP